jgi:hypothetical protein
MSPILTARLLVRRPVSAKGSYFKSTAPYGDTFTHTVNSMMPLSEGASKQTLRGVPHSKGWNTEAITGSQGMNLEVDPSWA